MITFKAFLSELRKIDISDLKKADSKHIDVNWEMHQEIRNEIVKIADRFGVRQIGFGNFATVFKGPNSSYVIKVFSNSDIGYSNWIKFVVANQHNKHVPKLLRKPVKIPNTNLTMVRMEALLPTNARQKAQVRKIIDNYDDNLKSKLDKDWISILDFVLGPTQDALADIDPEFDNIMSRANGTIVVTDPLYGYSPAPLEKKTDWVKSLLKV